MRRPSLTICLGAATLLAVPSRDARAQAAPARRLEPYCSTATAGMSFSDRVDIVHSLNTSREVAQPAFAQYTKPEPGDATGAVSGAIKYLATATSCRSLGLFTEYIWNNATSKRQNTLRAGFDGDWQLRAIGGQYVYSPLVLGQVNYRGDREKHTESAEAVAQLTVVMRNQVWPAPNATWRVGRLFDLTWAPLLGLVYDQVLQAGDAAARGSILRFAPQVDVVVYPAGVQLDRRLELSYSYLLQVDIVDNTSEDDDRHERRRAGVSFFPFRSDLVAAGFTVARTSGEDPTKGYVDERFWQAGITLRVK
jgi:hypothetical protein